jgi:hypothetical protein
MATLVTSIKGEQALICQRGRDLGERDGIERIYLGKSNA